MSLAPNTETNSAPEAPPTISPEGTAEEAATAASQDARQFISFQVGEQEYGVDIMAVREIKGWTMVTKLPNTPEFVRGVLNLRGVIVPIFDLRCRFGMGKTDATKLHVVIIVTVQERTIGILVDAVSDILTATADQIRPVPEMDGEQNEGFLDGLVTVEERMVALIAIEGLFDSKMVAAAANALAELNPTD